MLGQTCSHSPSRVTKLQLFSGISGLLWADSRHAIMAAYLLMALLRSANTNSRYSSIVYILLCYVAGNNVKGVISVGIRRMVILIYKA